MLETLNLGTRMTKETYLKVYSSLQERLRQLQYDLQKAEIATVVIFEGVDGAGKGTTITRLVERLDPRLYRVVPATAPTEEEAGRHFLWRYQMKLPADGSLTIYDRSWYGRVLVERLYGKVDGDQVRQAYTEIRDFERWLADDGQVIVKFWLHISKKTQKKRLKKLEKDRIHSWKVSAEDWKHHRDYDKWVRAAEQMLTATDTPHAPWTLVAASDKRGCRVQVFEGLVKRMEEALARRLNDPKAVSRTAVAAELTKTARAKSKAEFASKAKEAAAAAGLPLEEAPDPVKRPKGVKGPRRKAAKPKPKAKAKPAQAKKAGRK